MKRGPKALLIGLCLLSAMLLPAAAGAQPGSGTAVIAPSAGVVAGSSGTWTVTYTAADDFSTGIVRLVIPSGWSLAG